MPYLPYGIVVILNADGTIAHFRVDGVGQYDTEGNFKSTTDAGFDDQMLPGGSVVYLLVSIL